MTDPFDSQWRDIAGVLSEVPSAASEQRAEVPPLTDGERLLLYVASALAATVSILGLLSSFTSLEAKAGPDGWGWDWPWLLPVGMDLSIPAFTLAGLLLIRTDMPLAWVALVPRFLTGATMYLNWSAATTLPGRIGHAVLTLLWVVFSEIAGHVYASRVGLITGKRMEKIRRIRWVLAPLSTLAIWRRMNLWEETSYRGALQRQRDRLLARAGLRETHGWRWRWTSPRRDRVLLRLGDLNPADIFASETSETATGETETLPVETSETETWLVSETSETETGLTQETTTRETKTKVSPGSEAETSHSAYETETTSLATSETAETFNKSRRSETTTARRSRAGETETGSVSRLGDRDPEAEIEHLLGLIRDRGAENALGLKEAITETGRPKATAAKRLRAARDLYRAETAA